MSASSEQTELVAQARTGNVQAFTALFEAYHARMCTYLARLTGDDETGRDLAQDTFIAAWRALPRMGDDLQFGPWLFHIATNAARSYLRRAALIRWLPWGEQAESFAPSRVAGPEAAADDAEIVKLALAQLPAKCRVCLLLHAHAGFSQREIATMFGLSEKTVSAYVSRGRERFRHALRQLEREAGADVGHLDAHADYSVQEGTGQ